MYKKRMTDFALSIKPDESSPGHVLLLEQPLVRAKRVAVVWNWLVRVELSVIRVQLQITSS